jgi:hypothetical protein
MEKAKGRLADMKKEKTTLEKRIHGHPFVVTGKSGAFSRQIPDFRRRATSITYKESEKGCGARITTFLSLGPRLFLRSTE